MANMTTNLTNFSETGNSRTSTAPTHTALMPRIVIQKRSLPSGKDGVIGNSYKVVFGTVDATGAVIPQRISFEAVTRFPVSGAAGDEALALSLFREIIASDNFGESVLSQNWLQE